MNPHAYRFKKTKTEKDDFHLWGSFWTGCKERYKKKRVWAEMMIPK